MQASTQSHENMTGTIPVSVTQKIKESGVIQVKHWTRKRDGVRTKIIYVPGLLLGFFTFHICMFLFLSGKPIHMNIKAAPFLDAVL